MFDSNGSFSPAPSPGCCLQCGELCDEGRAFCTECASEDWEGTQSIAEFYRSETFKEWVREADVAVAAQRDELAINAEVAAAMGVVNW